jgi:hypothetical protein
MSGHTRSTAPRTHGLGRLAAAGFLLSSQAATAGGDGRPAAEPHSVVFAGADFGGSTYASSGFKRSLGRPLDQNAFILMGSSGAGILRDRDMRDGRLSRKDYLSSQASLLVGYQWMTPLGAWALLGGAETDLRHALVDGAAARPAEPRFGIRLQAEAWLHPSGRTLATGTVILGTAVPHLWARASWGWKAWRDAYLGPEAAVSLEPDYREARLGLHATGLSIGRFTLRLAGGLLLRSTGEPSAYATLGTHFAL